ncbi:nucleoside-diphosphate kinase [Amycolatopsis dendrobii]|uniref:Nucleoside-diphosphate kinase n=1 Tax=Amycolatopsis dendrobii TaxID=2760662 RepID=A0A7W3ZG34_9PSEU|nr:nucleoside-diphosphate kinase [Amycolatopsis dendrobii]MBB1160271.1 nucleoside-diphosphate kinase [Amycolatopsis dendrobii]
MDWAALTRMPAKRIAYRRETYFREGARDIARFLGDRTADIVRRHALLLVKPDGIAAGKVRPVLGWLGEQGFAVQTVQRPDLDGLRWREMWRYQLTSATVDRLALNDLIYRGSALLLLVRDEQPGPMPATMRLAALKGSADPLKQQPGTLRALLHQHNRNFSYVHVADEPADLIREIGLLLDPTQRREALNALVSGAPAGLPLLEEALEAAPAPRTFDADEAADAVADALKRAEHGGRALELLERLRFGELVPWIEVAEAVAESGAEVDRWDLAAAGAGLIECDEPGEAKLIANPDPVHWAKPRARRPL